MIQFAPIPFVASNLTDKELVRLIEHHYPNLQGPLKVAVERLGWKPQATRATEEPDEHSCQHCGATFTLASETSAL